MVIRVGDWSTLRKPAYPRADRVALNTITNENPDTALGPPVLPAQFLGHHVVGP